MNNGYQDFIPDIRYFLLFGETIDLFTAFQYNESYLVYGIFS